MDNTSLFLATVKMLKTRNKTLDAAPAMAMQRLRESCHFTQQAKAIVKDLTQLRDFLLSHRKDYVNIDHVLDGALSMSDYERDQIDTQSQTVLKKCTCVLKNLRNAVRFEKCSDERYEHRQEMVELVSAYLAVVAKIYGEQKAIRVSRAVDMKKLYRLANMIKYVESAKKRQRSPDATRAVSSSPDTTNEQHSSRQTSTSPERSTEARVVDSVENEAPKLRHRTVGSSTVQREGVSDDKGITKGTKNLLEVETKETKHAALRPKLAAMEADTRKQEEEWSNMKAALSDGEKQQLETEKKELFEELRGMADEIQILESKVMEIAQLQDIFTTKVLEQERDIYRINEVAIHTTENIKAGNESIREAMKKKAGFRVYILFFLLVMSFTLLFLDWYNP